MEIYELPHAAHGYPPPRVPMLPLFSPSDITRQHQGKHSSRFLENDVAFLPSGRLAIYYALKLMGVTTSCEVIVPAYHCGSMIEPVIYLGASPRFINLDADLKITPDRLAACITPKTKALLIPHYFGFPQQLTELKALCDQHHIALIEDCAHSFFSSCESSPVGKTGDFSITSTVKFFPGIEGGVLAVNGRLEKLKQITRRPPPVANQTKTVLHTLELAAQFKRLGALGALLRLRSERPSLPPPNGDLNCCRTRLLSRDTLHWFDPEQIGNDASWFTRYITRNGDHQKIIRSRIANFNHYLTRLEGVANLSPLHQSLPHGVVPYVFPLLLHNPEKDFHRLKQEAVPIWRWEELVKTDCKVSNDYRLKLIQLPCHQSLHRAELDWIIDTIISTVG